MDIGFREEDPRGSIGRIFCWKPGHYGSHMLLKHEKVYLGLKVRKPVFGDCDQVRAQTSQLSYRAMVEYFNFVCSNFQVHSLLSHI